MSYWSRAFMLSILLFITMLIAAAADSSEPGDQGGTMENQGGVCRYVAKHSTGVGFLRDRLLRYGVFDANNDGHPDIVERGRTGSAGGDAFDIQSPDGTKINYTNFSPEVSESLRGTYGSAWLPFGGRVYELHFNEEGARFVRAVTYLGPDNLGQLVCRFEQDVTEYLHSPRGDENDNRLCKRALAGDNLSLVAFDSRASISRETLNMEGRGWRHPIGRASFDFDNDGTPDDLVLVQLSSSAGRGCDVTYYDLTDGTGTEILHGPKRALLLEMQGVEIAEPLPHTRCQGVSRWLEHEGSQYFEMRFRGERPRRARELYHEIRGIRNGQIESVCSGSFFIRNKVVEPTK